MELRHLRYFVAVAEERHFGRAARHLNVAQPALSRQIQQLEQELGLKLFTRDRRKVELTYAGELFLERGHAILRDVEQAVAAARRADRGETGRLDIGHAPAADMILLPRVVSAFRQRYPDVTLTLRHLSGPQLLQALRDRRIQIALLRLPIDDADLHTVTLMTERLIAVLPADHRLAARAEVSVRELSDEPIVLFPRHLGPKYFDTIGAFCLEHGRFALALRQEADTIQSTLGLVAAGVGISLQPDSVRHMSRTGVVYKTIIESPACVHSGLAYHPSDMSANLAAFLDVSREIARTELTQP